MCAAFGRAQIKKLDRIKQSRIRNYEHLHEKLQQLDLFHLIEPTKTSQPSWFAFPLTLKVRSRESLGNHLEANGIRTRPFFAGNITYHKGYRQYFTPMPVTDKLMRDSLFIGIGQWLGKSDLDYIFEVIKKWKGSR